MDPDPWHAGDIWSGQPRIREVHIDIDLERRNCGEINLDSENYGALYPDA